MRVRCSWQGPLGNNYTISFPVCPSLTPFPTMNITNVNLTSTTNSSSVTITTFQDPGSALLGGFFTLSFSGSVWTPLIATTATNGQVASALLTLPEIKSVKVTRDTNPIALTGLLLYVAVLLPVMDFPLLRINGTQLTGAGVNTYVPVVWSARATGSGRTFIDAILSLSNSNASYITCIAARTRLQVDRGNGQRVSLRHVCQRHTR